MCLAIPGRIRSVNEYKEGYMRMGKVELGGIVKEINLQLVPEAQVGNYVLVHVGVAISMVDEEEARSSLEFLKQMNELDELYNSPGEADRSTEEKSLESERIISKMIS